MQSRVGQLDCSHGVFSRLFQTEGALQAGDASLTSLAALQLAVNDSLLQFSLQQLASVAWYLVKLSAAAALPNVCYTQNCTMLVPCLYYACAVRKQNLIHGFTLPHPYHFHCLASSVAPVCFLPSFRNCDS